MASNTTCDQCPCNDRAQPMTGGRYVGHFGHDEVVKFDYSSPFSFLVRVVAIALLADPQTVQRVH